MGRQMILEGTYEHTSASVRTCRRPRFQNSEVKLHRRRSATSGRSRIIGVLPRKAITRACLLKTLWSPLVAVWAGRYHSAEVPQTNPESPLGLSAAIPATVPLEDLRILDGGISITPGTKGISRAEVGQPPLNRITPEQRW